MRPRARDSLISWLIVGPFAILLASPFYWMLMTSLKTNGDLYNIEHNPFVFNEPATLDHLRLLLFDTHFVTYLLNTFRVGIAVVEAAPKPPAKPN